MNEYYNYLITGLYRQYAYYYGEKHFLHSTGTIMKEVVYAYDDNEDVFKGRFI